MRADEAITIENADSMFVGMNYINQLRYERLMAKARYFGILAYHCWFKEDGKDIKCDRICIALEARARKIKEGML